MLEVPREQLLALLSLAEDLVIEHYDEYDAIPSDDDRELLLSMWGLLGVAVPEWFRRTFGWKI